MRKLHKLASAKGFTVVELVFALCLVSLPFSLWVADVLARQEAEKTALFLKEKAPAAETAYMSRAGAYDYLGRLSAKAAESRAPGHYQNILESWIAASAQPVETYAAKPKPVWLLTLERSEHQEVMKELRSLSVSTEDLVQLSLKLGAISPQLTASETAKVESLANPANLLQVAYLQTATLKKIVPELIRLGASEQGLRRNGIVLPKGL